VKWPLPKPKVTEQSPRLFQNDLVEMLSRTSPGVVVAIYLPTALGLLWYSVARGGVPVPTTVLVAAVGAAAWTLTEYWLHRAIMHWVPNNGWGARMHFWIHGIHHEWPKDPYRLVMPPSVSLVLFFLFLALWTAVFGRSGWAFHGGFTLGYLAYDLSHYFYHHRKPEREWLVRLQRHHLRHHFHPRYEERNFAITVPWWDRIFGTATPAEPSGPVPGAARARSSAAEPGLRAGER